MCLYPKILTNPRYLPNKKNNFNPPICDDNRKKYVAIGCGKCIECRKKRVREWMIRIQWEEKTTLVKGRTITLTFSEESLKKLPQEANEACARAMKLFLKRWDKEKGRTIRHWFVTELGDENTERVHLHGIVWEKDWKDVERIWGYGNIAWGDKAGNTAVTEQAIRYMTKYVLKPNESKKDWVGKVLASKGIGAKFKDSETAKRYRKLGEEAPQYIKLSSGTKIDIPMYYRNKLFTDEEKEKIWVKLLERQERFVMGERIDVSTIKGEKEYERALMYYQKRNEEAGYSKTPWSKKRYYKSRKQLTPPAPSNIEGGSIEEWKEIFKEIRKRKNRGKQD